MIPRGRREQGRFVTLKSGRVIFIPKGYKSKWANVRDRIRAKDREPRVEDVAGISSWDIAVEWIDQLDAARGRVKGRELRELKRAVEMVTGYTTDYPKDKYRMVRVGDKVEAIGAAYFLKDYGHKTDDALYVHSLASAPKNSRHLNNPDRVRGCGTRLMIEFAGMAADRGVGMFLISTEFATRYYEKLGFEREEGYAMRLSPEKTKELANATIDD